MIESIYRHKVPVHLSIDQLLLFKPFSKKPCCSASRAKSATIESSISLTTSEAAECKGTSKAIAPQSAHATSLP